MVAVLLSCVPAHAELTCDQLGAVAQTTISMRDQGASLNAMLAEFERGELKQKLEAQELNVVRQLVRGVYLGDFSPGEIAESCKAGTLGLPKPKSKP